VISPQRAAAIAVVVVAVISIIAGLIVVGSPAEQRLLRLDERRVSDLQSLARALQQRHARTGRLPTRLEDAVDGLMLSTLPVDPVTSAPYEYEIVGESRFQLCATFSTASGRGLQDFWMHEPGRHCFELEVSELR
jgi:type II secretory pathway pseudopilin PulG